MVMPVCLFFCVFLFSSLRLFEELFPRERERGSRWIDVGVFPVLLVWLEQLEMVKQSLTSTRCKAPANEQKIEQ